MDADEDELSLTVTVSRGAAFLGISYSRMLQLVRAGRIAGCRRYGSSWSLPGASVRAFKERTRSKGGRSRRQPIAGYGEPFGEVAKTTYRIHGLGLRDVPSLVTIAEASRLFSVSGRLLSQLCLEGAFPGTRRHGRAYVMLASALVPWVNRWRAARRRAVRRRYRRDQARKTRRLRKLGRVFPDAKTAQVAMGTPERENELIDGNSAM